MAIVRSESGELVFRYYMLEAGGTASAHIGCAVGPDWELSGVVLNAIQIGAAWCMLAHGSF